jgi:trk system potassium uptake protein TrkA
VSERQAVKQQVAVIGLGRFGLAVARTMVADGHEVLGIDASEEAVQRARDVVTHAMQAVVYDAARVHELGLDQVDTAVIAIGTDVEANIVGTALLVEAGIPNVIARANSALHALILTRIGAHRVVIPEVTSGEEIAHSLRVPGITGYLALSPGAGISSLPAPPDWVGQPVGTTRLIPNGAASILAIYRPHGIVTAFGSDERIRADDLLILLTVEHLPGAATGSAPKLLPWRKQGQGRTRNV